MSAPALVQAERRGAFWFLRLNRPERRNALCAPLLEALSSACAGVESDPDARAAVLFGAGGHFCAGADVDEFETLAATGATGRGAADDPVVRHNRGFGRVLERLAALPVPTLGIVRGAAVGGGCGLAAALDHVIAVEDAVFALPEVTLGVVAAQVAPFVVRRAGPTRARWLMCTAPRLDAAAAVAAGLADAAVPLAALEAAVRGELEALARAEPAALRASRRVVALATTVPLAGALDGAAREFAALLHGGAMREGVAAARARRGPAWQVPVPALPEFA